MNAIDELLKAFELVQEYENSKSKKVKEYRLYYNDDGVIIGLWESDHPAGDNYVVIDHPDEFHRHNTHILRVINKKLIQLDTKILHKFNLKKSISGQKVVKGHAALALFENEDYNYIEYYDRADN